LKNTVQDFTVWAASLSDDFCSAKDLKLIGNLASIFLEELGKEVDE
jgi:hypothetical protein